MRSYKIETLRILPRSENKAYHWEKRIDGMRINVGSEKSGVKKKGGVKFLICPGTSRGPWETLAKMRDWDLGLMRTTVSLSPVQSLKVHQSPSSVFGDGMAKHYSRPTSSLRCRGSMETVCDNSGMDSVPALLLPRRDSGPTPSLLGVGSGWSATMQGAVEGGHWVTHSHHILLEGREHEKIR